MPGINRSTSISVTQIHQVDAVAQVRGCRTEHVASGERVARTLDLELGVRQLDRALRAADHRHRRCEQPVVRADQHPVAVGHFDGDRPSARADARVDDRQHDARRDVADAARQCERTTPDVERSDAVREVDHRGVRGDVADHRTNDTGELVDDAVVGQERDGVIAATHGSPNLPGPVGRVAVRRTSPQNATRAGANPPMAPALSALLAVAGERVSTCRTLEEEIRCEKWHVEKTCK